MIRVAVGILQRENKILIAERPAGKPYSGYWEFPGGKIEENEESKKAIIRELHEELGITVEEARLWFEQTHSYPDKTVLLEIWLIKKFSGEPRAQENQQLRWVTLPELLEHRQLEGNWPIIDRIKQLF